MEREIIEFSEPKLKFNINTVSSDASFRWRSMHLHEEVEIVYVCAGKVCVMLNEEKFFAEKGDTVFINGNVLHCIRDVENAEITYIQMDFSEYFEHYEYAENTHIYSFLTLQNTLPYCLCKSESELSDVFFAVKREIADKKYCYEMYVKSYARLLAAYMLRNRIVADIPKGILRETEKLSPVIQYIDKNYKSILNLDELSALIGCTKFDLCRKFKKATGRTVVDYINHVRVNSAKELLKDKKHTVTQIALECGFSSVQ